MRPRRQPLASSVRFARNADKVDGFHAVAADTSARARAGKLVATDRRGRFPNRIIRKAPDASRLEGKGSEAFVSGCGPGALRGQATVPADVTSGYEEVPGFGTVHGGPFDPRSGSNCHLDRAAASHVSTGIYHVDLGTVGWDCDEPPPAEILTAFVTPIRAGAAPLVADYRPVCDERGVVAEVLITDLQGTPVDASFAIAFIDESGLPIP